MRPDRVPKTQADSNTNEAMAQAGRERVGSLVKPWRKKTPPAVPEAPSACIYLRRTHEGVRPSQQAGSES